MIFVDTSVWIDVLRDKQGDVVESFRKKTYGETLAFCPFPFDFPSIFIFHFSQKIPDQHSRPCGGGSW